MPNTILEKLWRRTMNSGIQVANDNWNEEVKALYELGIGMEATLRYLYFEKPDFEAFKLWINQKKKVLSEALEQDIENILSEEDLAFWDANGYVIVKEAISEEDCKATCQAIWDFLGMDLNDKESWYKTHEELRGLMLNFTDHETLNRNRLSPRIRKAYEQLYKSSAIYKTIDKVSFNPPETEDFHFKGSDLHWDIRLKNARPFCAAGITLPY
jgi:hypothetical protein